jgi:hypothetical protein
MSQNAAPALVRKPVQITVTHRGRTLMDQVFQTTPIRIGRMLDNDIVLPFDFASRYHCEIRFDGHEWVAVDLGSKNGLVVGNNPQVRELKLADKSEFKIKEVTIHLSLETNDEITGTFNAYRESKAPVIAPTVSRAASRATSRSAPSSTVKHSKKNRAVQVPSGQHGPGKTGPLVDYDLNGLMCQTHSGISQANKKAVQMIVIWHDQILETREFACESQINWNWNGDVKQLGQARPERTTIKAPKGCTPDRLTITPAAPASFRVSDAIAVHFRYVPKSKALPLNMSFSDEKMIDPMILSGGIHGAAAITALFMAHKHPPAPLPQQEPERFAKIIIPIPTPPPLEVAVNTPTPTPAPVPTATPPLVAEATPPPPPEVKVKPKKTVVIEKKMKKMAIARSEQVNKHVDKTPPKKNVEPPPDQKMADMDKPPDDAPLKVADQPPVPEPPAATPQPIDVKTVGALATLSLLKAGPAVSNTQAIQVSRAPASLPGDMVGGTPVKGTGDMISSLAQSAHGGGAGKGDGQIGIASGKIKGGYAMNGTSGKTGNRKIKGSVLGGATYTELTKNEGLTRDQVMKEVQRHQSEIQQCYERSLLDNPDMVGRAEFEWEISPMGAVSDVKVKEATVKNGESLLTCVKGVFAGMKFPKSKNGEGTTPTIGLPFGRL